MILTARHIDKACRDGLFVWTGNRQAISGCQLELKGQRAEHGKVFICMESTREWEQVPLTQIVVENRKGESEMPAGKGAPGRITHIASKRSSKKAAAKANNGNLELEGMDPENRRIAAIEDAEEARQSASQAISKAQEEYEEAEKAVIAAMHDNGFSLKRRPVYTRPPWGSVSLQQKGEVKEKVKFTPIKKKASKKKGEDDED